MDIIEGYQVLVLRFNKAYALYGEKRISLELFVLDLENSATSNLKSKRMEHFKLQAIHEHLLTLDSCPPWILGPTRASLISLKSLKWYFTNGSNSRTHLLHAFCRP